MLVGLTRDCISHVGIALLVVRATASHNGLADPANPIVLFGFGIRVQEKARFRSGNFKRVALFGFQIGRLDRGARGQVHHVVRGLKLVLAKKQLAALEDAVAAPPFLCQQNRDPNDDDDKYIYR